MGLAQPVMGEHEERVQLDRPPELLGRLLPLLVAQAILALLVVVHGLALLGLVAGTGPRPRQEAEDDGERPQGTLHRNDGMVHPGPTKIVDLDPLPVVAS